MPKRTLEEIWIEFMTCPWFYDLELIDDKGDPIRREAIEFLKEMQNDEELRNYALARDKDLRERKLREKHMSSSDTAENR